VNANTMKGNDPTYIWLAGLMVVVVAQWKLVRMHVVVDKDI